MARQYHHDLSKVSKIDGPFVPITIDLATSAAWRCRPINVVRLIEYLMIEHMRHGGHENGNLIATYNQLVAFGMSRGLISKSLSVAERLRLVEVFRFGRKSFTDSYPLRFRLTFLPFSKTNERGQEYHCTPTNEWKRITDDAAADIVGRKNRFRWAEVEPGRYQKWNSAGTRSGTVGRQKTAILPEYQKWNPYLYLQVTPAVLTSNTAPQGTLEKSLVKSPGVSEKKVP